MLNAIKLFGTVVQKVRHLQSVREAVNNCGLFTAGWFSVREKYYYWLEIYDHLRANEQAAPISQNHAQTGSSASTVNGPHEHEARKIELLRLSPKKPVRIPKFKMDCKISKISFQQNIFTGDLF